MRYLGVVSALVCAAVFMLAACGAPLYSGDIESPADTLDDLLFIHHSVGNNWLEDGLHSALLAKSYVDERNDAYYGTVLDPDPGRGPSLGDVPGDLTDMHHWILWFNDYLEGVKLHGSADGMNHIIMFKSCYPNSNISSDGSEPGNPFSSEKTLANYKAVYRHPDGTGHSYTHDGAVYWPLEDVFASNPDVLFIPVTAPPLHYAPADATTDANAHRAREFNNWLKDEWLPAYNAAHPGLNNVAVFDFFDVLAYADDDPAHPNRLKAEYGGESGDSHPNTAGNLVATEVFAGVNASFIDGAWARYSAVTNVYVYLPITLSGSREHRSCRSR